MKALPLKTRVFLLLMVPVTLFAFASGVYFLPVFETRALLVLAAVWLVCTLLALWLAQRYTTSTAFTPVESSGQLQQMTDVMHEVRSPLYDIDNFTDQLLSSLLDPDQIENVLAIRHTSQNMLAVLNNALKMDQLEAGDFQVNAIAFNLRECVEDVISILTPAIHKKQIDVILFIYSDVPEAVIFDPALLRQLLINLVANALKFTAKGNVIIRVMLDEEIGQDVGLKFTVTDTGSGMDETRIANLFRVHTQTEPAGHENVADNGRGLDICQKIIGKIGGDIGASSTPGEGSEFWFSLHCNRSNSTGLMRTYPAMRHKNIVIYDCNETSLLALRNDLSGTGAHPISVTRLRDVALVPTKGRHISWKIDAVYLSLSPQECHDDAVITHIAQICTGYHCPVIALSYCAGSMIEKMYAAGISRHIYKPARLSAVTSALTEPSVLPAHTASGQACREAADIPPSVDIKVLVAEDNTINARLISAIMDQCGISPIIVSNGRDAIEVLENNDIDIVLMDIHMPVMDGLDATRYIREQLISDVPVIAVTANAVPGEIERFYAAGIDECLIKPIRTHQLFRLFKQYLDIDLAPDYEAMNEIQRDILMAEEPSIDNDLMKYKARILACMRGEDREKLLEHVHKLNGIASFFNYDTLRKHVDALETAVKNGESLDTLYPLADHVYMKIDDALKSRRAG